MCNTIFKEMNVSQVKIEAIIILFWAFTMQSPIPYKACLNVPKISKNGRKLMTSPIMQFNAKKTDCLRKLIIIQKVNTQSPIVKRSLKDIFELKKKQFFCSESWCTFHFENFDLC